MVAGVLGLTIRFELDLAAVASKADALRKPLLSMCEAPKQLATPSQQGRMRQLKLFSMSFACLLAALASVSLLLQEIRVLFQPQRAEAGFYDHIVSGNLQYAPSSYSRKLVLGDCSFALLNIARAGGAEQQSALARSCEQISQEIASAMPTNSQAWYVNALSHA
ncbi:hypothetical protein, partial [Pseudorhizobium marinum]|uniref:hypothetical protein n=1 Tax=Pseudorhizobium marinum TaxID=1496690 RepID=UPI0005631E25